MLIQRAMAAINQSTAVAQAATSGQLIAAAYAPAATAVTIATEGQAAVAAPEEYAAALALIQAEAVAHEGGPIERRRFHSGGLAHDEVPIIAQEGEIMIRRDVAQQPGMAEFLLGLNESYHDGGGVRRFAGRRRRFRTGRFGPRGGGDSFFFGSGAPSFFGGGYGGGRFGDFFGSVVEINPPGGIPGEPQTMTPPDIPPSDPGITITYPGGRIATLGPNWATEGFDPGTFDPGLFGGPLTPGPFAVGSPFFTPMGDITTIGPSGYPMAIPLGPFSIPTYPAQMDPGAIFSQVPSPTHRGGRISTRMHSGGTVGGGGGIHIYAFTDLSALTKHMSSREGQKIIFETVKGRRIDLGF